MRNPYKYADKAIKILNKRFISSFGKLKSTILIDQINALQSVNLLYEEIYEITRKVYYRTANESYGIGYLLLIENGFNKETLIESQDTITYKWIDRFLNRYDPVTKYVFKNETDRKRARLFESLMADKSNKPKEVDTALRYWSAMVSQYAIELTDEAILQTYKDNGIKKVIWKTEKDEKVCSVCSERDNKIYKIGEIPPKPHINCRCYYLPYKEKNDNK